ncbi:MAG: SET domain-containing protein-lysine N-methyltransferase [Leptospiraceae bacterium]|nr:SET domain-containing protein-lysine N-methyltransferase [Leptospiraceae bacterium]
MITTITKKEIITAKLDLCESGDIDHKSLFTSSSFEPGEIISEFGYKEIFKTPNYLTVQLDKDKHILLDPEYLQYINHSCEPNVHFNTTKMVVEAIKYIPEGEQLTFFYPSTEWTMDRSFECLCGSEHCLKLIEGASKIPLNILNNYHLSAYIKSLI